LASWDLFKIFPAAVGRSGLRVPVPQAWPYTPSIMMHFAIDFMSWR
jgi:hypothetical protein